MCLLVLFGVELSLSKRERTDAHKVLSVVLTRKVFVAVKHDRFFQCASQLIGEAFE